MKGSNSEGSALSPELEHDMIINLTSPTEKKFLPRQFKLPSSSTKYHPRKNRFRLKYKVGYKSWFSDSTNSDSSLHSPNSSLDYNSCYIYKSIRIMSRSARIMRALSSSSSSYRHQDEGIRKLLNFDSTPSPKENSSYENSSSSINSDTPTSTLSSSLTDFTDSNVPTAESIDENQNQTPQQNRKHIKISSNKTDLKEHTAIQSRTSYLMSLLQKEQKKKPDEDANHGISLHPFRSFNPFNNGPGRVVTASTPRNLSQEFNQEIHDRPHTPENMINVIPESISAIKKSHKKEKLYCHEEQSAQQTDVSVKNDNSYPKTTTESSETDVIAETSAASESESQKKNRNTKRTLIYNLNDECSDIRSDFDRKMQQKPTLTGTNLLEDELDQIESNKMQNIDSNDCESHKENMQVDIHLIDDNDEKEDRFKVNVCNEEVSQLSLQKELSDICNVTSENKIASPESNPIVSQDASSQDKVVTPENHVKVLKHVLTESIKKSHKKMKHENRKKLFKTKDRREIKLAKSETSLEDACNDDQDIKSQTADTICVSSPQNFEFDRPGTPKNVNSSRLLLLDFNSVKKSHKKDKRSKRTSSFIECRDYKYRERSNDSLQNSRYEEENIDRNDFRELKESPGMSPKKRKKSRSVYTLQSSTPKMSSAFMSLGCKNIDDEFKIYTPIKKPILLTVTDYIPPDEMSQKRNAKESAQATSNEIDCSRCMTPVARFKELRKNEDLESKRDNATRFETDISVLRAADSANLNDKNGRSTPINMSTMELLHNKDSIKKSHKKDKHSRSKRPTSEKKRSYIQESKHVNFINNEKVLEERTALSLKHHVGNHCTEKEVNSIMREKEEDNSYKEIDYDDPQPSTSRGGDNIEDAKSIQASTVSKFLNMTPPNSLNAMKFIKLLHTTSIKKSHKKERDMNAQTKYIFMSQEHEMSDDGSIFDEEDRLNFMDINDNNTEITTM